MGPCTSVNTKPNHSPKTQSRKPNYTGSNASSGKKWITTGDYLLPNDLTKKTSILKDYTLSTEFLGKGGSGIVSEGIDKQGKKYAIKRINKLIIKNVTNILEEVEISLTCSNDHIIKVHEVYEDHKTISFVMELIEGGDLFDFITRSPIGHLTDIDALEIITQILSAVDYLHNDQKIVHRDLKPENFLVLIKEKDNRPYVKLIDFGFSCHIPRSGTMNEDLGSPIYTAPEILEGVPYNEKVDLWSVGIILFNMLTGFQPFSPQSDSDLKEEVLTKDIDFDVIQHDKLRELCIGLLQKDPNDRFNARKALEIARRISIEDSNVATDSSDGKDDVIPTTLPSPLTVYA